MELVEDHAVGLAHDRCEHVQPPAVGHADDDLVDAERAAPLDDLLHGRDHGLRAIEAEPLGAGEPLVQEAFKAFGLDQLLQDGLLAIGGEGDLLVLALDPLLQPGLLLGIGDVHVLQADVTAVGATQDREDLADVGGLEPQHIVQEDRTVVVALGEPVARRVELCNLDLRLQAKGIEVGLQVPADAEGADHHDRAHRVQRRRTDIRGGCFRLLLGKRLGDLGLDRRP